MTEREQSPVHHDVSVVEEEKELLRRRLELLQREYERTALRLQRAERRDVVRRHVRSRISEYNQSGLHQTEAPPFESNRHNKPAGQSSQGGSGAPAASPAPSGSAGFLQTRSSPGSMGAPHTRVTLGSPHTRVPSSSVDSPPSSIGSPHIKVPSVQFHLPTLDPVLSPKSSPAHRLRSKRSRLRLAERERDTESSQEKAREKDRESSQGKERERDGESSQERDRDGESSEEKERESGREKSQETDIDRYGKENYERDEVSCCQKERERDGESRRGKEGKRNEDSSLESERRMDGGRKHGAEGMNITLNQSEARSRASDLSLQGNLSGSPASGQSLRRRLSTKLRRPAEKVVQSEPTVTPTHPVDQSQPVASPAHHPLDQSGLMASPMHHPLDQSDSVVAPSQDAVTASSQSGGLSGKEEVIGGAVSQWETSCTLVDGLLFPVEYYVRTTRRMANSQSPLDLQAVILSQLSRGRTKRRASQPRSSATPTAVKTTSQPIKPDDSSQDSAFQMKSKAIRLDDCALQTDSKPIRVVDSVLQMESKPIRIVDSSLQNDSKPIRARRRRRGAGWGRRQKRSRIPSPSWSSQQAALDTESHPLPEETDTSHLQTHPQAHSEPMTAQDHTVTCPQTHSEPITGQDHTVACPQHQSEPIKALDQVETHLQIHPEPIIAQDHAATRSQHQSEPITVPHDNAESQQKPLLLPELYPVFKRGCGQKRKHAQTEKEGQVSLLQPSLASLLRTEDCGSLRNLLLTFELQDFHLPDDEYGHLKLQKLRPLATEVEPYSPQTCSLNTRRSNRRRSNKTPGNSTCPSLRCGRPLLGTHPEDGDWLSPDPLLLSPTPTGSEVLGPQQLSSQSERRVDEVDQSEAQEEPVRGLTDADSQSDTFGQVDDQSHGGGCTSDQSEKQGDPITDQWDEGLAGSRLEQTDGVTHSETHNGLDTHTQTHNGLDTHIETHNSLDTHILAGKQTHTSTDTHTETHTLADKLRDTHTSAHTHKSSDIHTEIHTLVEKPTDTPKALDTHALPDTHTHLLKDTHTTIKTRPHTHSCTPADSLQLSSSNTHVHTHTNASQLREEHTHTHTHTLLNLSLSLTSHTQSGHDLDLPSLGSTPFSPPCPPMARALFRSRRSLSVHPSLTSSLNPSPSPKPASDWLTETRETETKTWSQNQRTIHVEKNQRTIETKMEGNQRSIGAKVEKKQKTVVSSPDENHIMGGTITEENQVIPGTVTNESLFGTWEDENQVMVTEENFKGTNTEENFRGTNSEENCKGTYTEKGEKGPKAEENLKRTMTVAAQRPTQAASPLADHTPEPSPTDSQLVGGAPDLSPSDSLLVEGVLDSSPADSLLVEGAPEPSLTDSVLVEGAYGSSPTDSLLVGHAKEPSQNGLSLADRHTSLAPADSSLVDSVPDLANTTLLEDGKSILQLKHTLKGAVEGCVYDVCVVRSDSGALTMCVAGEWSVCVWTEDTPSHWKLLHTWRFTQSVVSLFSIPDSDGLLCVTLGQLEITEARVLSTGRLSERVVCEGVCLRTVVGVSSCRFACGHTSKSRQGVEVHTLSKEGSASELVRLVSSDSCIESLVAVENQSDALIGWTDSSAVVIWNMRTGHLLQTIELGHMVSTATCLRGYSYNGMVCVLLQSVCVSEEKSECVFTLVGLNPINRKTAQLNAVNTHSSERFVESDVIGSAVVGVSPSGCMVLCDMHRGGASLLEGGVISDCHLARWAGPNILLTGQKNGDVCVYQYTPVENTHTDADTVS